jgi:ribonuclease HIII
MKNTRNTCRSTHKTTVNILAELCRQKTDVCKNMNYYSLQLKENETEKIKAVYHARFVRYPNL